MASFRYGSPFFLEVLGVYVDYICSNLNFWYLKGQFPIFGFVCEPGLGLTYIMGVGRISGGTSSLPPSGGATGRQTGGVKLQVVATAALSLIMADM